MKSPLFAICGCAILMFAGCQRQKPATPVTKGEMIDTRVTARMAQDINKPDEFKLRVAYQGKLDMSWCVVADAFLLYLNPNGKLSEIHGRTPGYTRFKWKERDTHDGFPRRDNPLEETLVLDKTGLAPGTYVARPSVIIFEDGKDELTQDTYYKMRGIGPGKSEDLTFTIK